MTYTPFNQLATAAFLGALSLPALAQDKVTFQLDWLPGGDKAPIYVCVNEDICADAGLEISIEQGCGSSEAITKLATGVSDVGTVTFMIAFFPLIVSMTTGLKATPPELIELSRSLRAPAFREITQIRLPYAVPYVFSGLKISITLAVIGAVIAEFVAADVGIGYFIQFSTFMFRLSQAWAGLLLLVVLSLTLFQIVSLLQKRLFPTGQSWHTQLAD